MSKTLVTALLKEDVLPPKAIITGINYNQSICEQLLLIISNSNWTEWSTIQGVITRVIQNGTGAKCEADFKLRAQ